MLSGLGSSAARRLRGARIWSSTSAELAQGLPSRGFEVIHKLFSGTLHTASEISSIPHRTDLANEVERVAEDAAYAVVMVFSDGNRWQSADARLLARLKPLGPVFWFDEPPLRAHPHL
ncbi:hypothetical protein [Mesorhizobium sp. M0571]|uniref:hypothetical protein n=1 Tax=Mesorhizobium sp. M0571 TaxID=2956960 RepID=UPI00333B226F